jgi:large subunit ribosomal protein L23
MTEERIASLLIAPIMSEKASILSETQGTYTFKVATNSTKFEIKKAVESMFMVQVDSVQTVSCLGKTKRKGQKIGRTKNWKKAYVQLAPGQKIDFAQAKTA